MLRINWSSRCSFTTYVQLLENKGENSSSANANKMANVLKCIKFHAVNAVGSSFEWYTICWQLACEFVYIVGFSKWPFYVIVVIGWIIFASFCSIFFIILIWVHIFWLIFQMKCHLQIYKYPAAEAPEYVEWFLLSMDKMYCFTLLRHILFPVRRFLFNLYRVRSIYIKIWCMMHECVYLCVCGHCWCSKHSFNRLVSLTMYENVSS